MGNSDDAVNNTSSAIQIHDGAIYGSLSAILDISKWIILTSLFDDFVYDFERLRAHVVYE